MENGYGELIEALSKAQKRFKPITKTKTARVFSVRTGKEFTYRYADLAEIIDNVKDALSDEGLAVSHVMESIQNGDLVLKTMLMHKNGKIMQSVYPLPKTSTPQEMGSALTYARRYTLCGILGISADEDDDAQVAQDSQKQNQKPVPTPKAEPKKVTPQQEVKTESFDENKSMTLPFGNEQKKEVKTEDIDMAVDEADLSDINRVRKDCGVSVDDFNALLKNQLNASRFGDLKKKDLSFLKGLLNSRKGDKK